MARSPSHLQLSTTFSGVSGDISFDESGNRIGSFGEFNTTPRLR